MAQATPADPEREYRLIEQLELRIASANTSEKLESILLKFLPALVLKLASENVGSRNLAIKVCQYVNQRLKIDEGIQLPVEALSKTFSEIQNAFVRQFCLLFIQQGFARLPKDGRVKALPGVLKSAIKTGTLNRNDEKMCAIALDFLMDTLRHWKIPEHDSKDDMAMKESFLLSEAQTDLLTSLLTKFLLYDPKTATTLHVNDDIKSIYEKQFSARGGVVPNIARFFFTSLFTDNQRLVPAVVLSVDANSEAANSADIMFKQCNFDFETNMTVDSMFELYDIGKSRLQTRVLSLLSRSQKSTDRTSKILNIVEEQLTSDTGGLEAAKLRAAIFNYLTWAVRISPDVGSIAAKLQDSLKEYIELQGWPKASDPSASDSDLRSKAYESIGLLASSKGYDGSQARQSPLELITWLFTSLRCDTSPNARHSIEEALSRVMNTVQINDSEDLEKFKSLLLWNVLSEENEEDPIYYFPTKVSAKYPAVRFANKCLPFSDVDARLIDIVALNSERREIAEEGSRGLDPYWHASNSKIAGKTDPAMPPWPSTKAFVERVFKSSHHDTTREAVALTEAAALTGAVNFARSLIAFNAWKDTEFAIDAEQDLQARIEALIENERDARQEFQTYFNQLDSKLVKMLLMASLKGLTHGFSNCANVALQLIELSRNTTLSLLSNEFLALCDTATSKSAVQLQACQIVGIVGSLKEAWEANVAQNISQCNDWSRAVGQEILAVKASLLKATYILSRKSLRQPAEVTHDKVRPLWQIVVAILEKSTDKFLRETAFEAMTQLGLCLKPAMSAELEVLKLFDILMKDAKKESEAAVSAIGSLVCFGYSNFDTSQKEHIVDKIFELHEIRKAEFHFAAGKALAVASLGFKSSSTITNFNVDASIPSWCFSQELFDKLLGRTLEDCKTTKPSLRKAVAIWLLSLIQLCDDIELLKPRLRDCQAAFSKLLTDRDEVVQETGSRGLGIVYEKGDKNLREDLVRDLVQSFTGSNAKMSGTVNEETQLFERGALPTEQGQSVSTYKDIVSLAQEMGDPSLVYRFMNLASSNAIWSSRAAFGRFGLSGVLADSSYLSENKKFYPKLFRYRFDPNPNVQRSMDDIWKALVKDPNSVIEENFDLIMEDLLKSIVLGKDWRAREASCAAIADLVQGREIEKFEKYLEDIWNVAFKVLDDIKETVRLAAMKLCRTLTSMLTRNLEVGEGNTKRASAMLNHALPFLLKQMEGGAAKEAQQYAIITLLDITKKAPASSLQHFAPTILETLINSLSSLEHESINYLHLNADKYGLTAEKLDKMRVSSVSSSPVTEAIERCLESLSPAPTNGSDAMEGVEPQPLEDAMKRLESTFKTTIGLPSKVGLSRVLVTLVVRHHAMFRPYADRFVRLTRKSLLDRNATISVSFGMALAYLLRLASEKEILGTCHYAKKLYFESQELSHRAVAGELVQSIGKVSSDVFTNFATSFLPFAFIGRHDLEADARDRFDVAWKENVGGSRALNLYLKEIVELTSIHIKSSLWPIRHACCFAVADLVSSLDVGQQYGEAEAKLLWPLMEEALSGKTWDGKEKVVSALPKFVKKATVLWPQRTEQMEKIAFREAKRTNAAYRPHAIAALGELALSRQDLELTDEIVSMVTHLFDELLDPDSMDVDDKDDLGLSSSKLLDETISSAIKCLFASLRPHMGAEVLEPAIELVKRAQQQQTGGISMAVYDGARQIFEKDAQKPTIKDAENETEQAAQEKPAAFGKAYERFWETFVTDCLAGDPQRHSEAPEQIRRARVDVARSLAQSGILNLDARGTLATVFDMWLKDERSRPLRQTIEQAAQANKTVLGVSVTSGSK